MAIALSLFMATFAEGSYICNASTQYAVAATGNCVVGAHIESAEECSCAARNTGLGVLWPTRASVTNDPDRPPYCYRGTSLYFNSQGGGRCTDKRRCICRKVPAACPVHTHRLVRNGACAPELEVRTRAECDCAANELQMTDKISQPTFLGLSETSHPPGCYYKPSNDGQARLWFDDSGAFGYCSGERICLCGTRTLAPSHL